MALLSWGLVSPVEYAAGQELIFNLHFEAPANTEAKKFYILGGLYTVDGTYIPDTLFGILKAAEVDYGVNDPVYISLWKLEPEQAVDLPCRFILSQSNCLVALFLMGMVGDAPSLSDDEQIAQILVELTAPPTVTPPPTVLEQLMPLVAVVLVFGMVGMMAPMIKKEVK